jgi:hypothetical protein
MVILVLDTLLHKASIPYNPNISRDTTWPFAPEQVEHEPRRREAVVPSWGRPDSDTSISVVEVCPYFGGRVVSEEVVEKAWKVCSLAHVSLAPFPYIPIRPDSDQSLNLFPLLLIPPISSVFLT